jgi:hypothetical protein
MKRFGLPIVIVLLNSISAHAGHWCNEPGAYPHPKDSRITVCSKAPLLNPKKLSEMLNGLEIKGKVKGLIIGNQIIHGGETKGTCSIRFETGENGLIVQGSAMVDDRNFSQAESVSLSSSKLLFGEVAPGSFNFTQSIGTLYQSTADSWDLVATKSEFSVYFDGDDRVTLQSSGASGLSILMCVSDNPVDLRIPGSIEGLKLTK